MDSLKTDLRPQVPSLPEERTGLLTQNGATIWLTGLSASGKVRSSRSPLESAY